MFIHVIVNTCSLMLLRKIFLSLKREKMNREYTHHSEMCMAAIPFEFPPFPVCFLCLVSRRSSWSYYLIANLSWIKVDPQRGKYASLKLLMVSVTSRE